MIFADDEEVKDLSDVKTVGLVDFNELNPEFSSLADRVHYIIDHHVDSKLYLDTLKEEREIRLVGSAATLVIGNLMKTDAKIDSDLALFMSAPLTLDSSNFNKELFNLKWTDEDVQVF